MTLALTLLFALNLYRTVVRDVVEPRSAHPLSNAGDSGQPTLPLESIAIFELPRLPIDLSPSLLARTRNLCG